MIDNYDHMLELYKDEKVKEMLKCLMFDCVETIGRCLINKDSLELSENMIKEIELHQKAYKFLNNVISELSADDE